MIIEKYRRHNMSRRNKPFNLRQLILSNFEKAKEIEAEAAERSKQAQKFSEENLKEIRKRQEEFKHKWQ